jgi:hypothetical protein
MRYDMSTAVEFQFADIITLPSITMSFLLPVIADWENTDIKSKCEVITAIAGCKNMTADELSNQLGQQFYDDIEPAASRMMKLFSVSDLIHNLTLPIDSLIDLHRRWNGEDYSNLKYYDHMNDSFDAIKFQETLYMNFKISWKKPIREINYWYAHRRRPDYLRFLFNSTQAAHAKIVFLSYSGNDESEIKEWMTISLSPGKTYSSYDRYVSKFLPAPYATDCRDYSAESNGKILNRLAMYESCFNEACFRRFGAVPLGNFLSKKDSIVKQMTLEFYRIHKQVIDELQSECERLSLKQDCIQNINVPRLKSSTANRSRSSVTHIFYLPSTPTAHSESMARISIENFITDVLSTIGFWLGMSALDVLKWVLKSAGTFFRKRGSERRQIQRMLTTR